MPQPPELQPMTQYLDCLITERVAEFSGKVLPNDPQLQKNRAEMGKFLKLLENLLPQPDSAVILAAINETACVMATRCQELVYRRGLEDGAELAGILARNGRERSES
ncbi:hypothetical protein EDC14_105810 [Hydrogenispora ethanolica]|uniref:Uncharacterized protein n=1 Tax=Hydrogenispora ethanolica TaxID=1082276 RepID=A0A4R1QNS2_HYDET|nr:hypothetical protein [Hydrogenispora ethanolica]TCL54957.1 hypothetical protein EDC14_105810 [Hydrogenispora ethanolica]